MPRISNKGANTPASPIRKLAPYAAEAKKAGVEIFHLNIGQPDIPTPPQMLDAVRNMDMTVLAYSPSDGQPVYRQKLLDHYNEQEQFNLTHENFIVTTGGSEALQFGFFTCLDAGDEIIVPEPFYANYNGFAAAGDIVVKTLTSTVDTGYALPPIADFEKLITEKTKAILICNPSNPTGYLYTKEELETLRDLVLKYDLFLFADEVYREFCYDGKVHHSVLNMDGLEQHAVVIDSVSKKYSACGARVGALISRNKQVMQTALKFAQARLSPPTLAQIAAEAALEVEEEYFENAKAEYLHRRNLIVMRLNAIEGVVCPTPGGAFYVFPQLPVDDAEKFCIWLLEEFRMDNSTVMMAPGHGFYATPNSGKQQVRIAYVLNEDSINQAMDCLEEALKTYPGVVLPEDVGHASN